MTCQKSKKITKMKLKLLLTFYLLKDAFTIRNEIKCAWSKRILPNLEWETWMAGHKRDSGFFDSERNLGGIASEKIPKQKYKIYYTIELFYRVLR